VEPRASQGWPDTGSQLPSTQQPLFQRQGCRPPLWGKCRDGGSRRCEKTRLQRLGGSGTNLKVPQRQHAREKLPILWPCVATVTVSLRHSLARISTLVLWVPRGASRTQVHVPKGCRLGCVECSNGRHQIRRRSLLLHILPQHICTNKAQSLQSARLRELAALMCGVTGPEGRQARLLQLQSAALFDHGNTTVRPSSSLRR
jgi:hypothetical protein